MKRILFHGLCLLLLTASSCSKIFVYYTKPSSTIHEDSTQYVFENDSVKITYDFWQRDGQMEFSIYNKLNTPIYIDWKNSALISDDNKYAYWIEKEIRNERSSGMAYGSRNSAYGVSASHSVAIKDERLSSIPPKSLIKKRMPQTLHSTFAPKVKGQKRNIRFRNFLAIAMNEDLKGQTYIDNGFYVANISRVKMNKIEPNHKHFWVYSKVTIK